MEDQKRIWRNEEGACSTYNVDLCYLNLKGIQPFPVSASLKISVIKIQQCSDSIAVPPDIPCLIIYKDSVDMCFPPTHPQTKHLMYASPLIQFISFLFLHSSSSLLIFLIQADTSDKGPSKQQPFSHCLPVLIPHQ